MIGPIVIDDLRPRTPSGRYPAKAVVGEAVTVSADVFRDGHAVLAARCRWRRVGARRWSATPMVHVGNDRWEGEIRPDELGPWEFVVEAWTDRYASWRRDVELKHAAGQDVELELREGAELLAARAAEVAAALRPTVAGAAAVVADAGLAVARRLAAGTEDSVATALAGVPEAGDLTASGSHRLVVERERALRGAWYELFPRSEGGLAAAAATRLGAIAGMGFDVVYLPPVHPIGTTHRKGRDNTLVAGPDDPGSPWAIGSPAGGHTDLEPSLGTWEDFDGFVAQARRLGMEVALDYALQCSPDHPWVAKHPEWFHRRPDGSIRYAENPPKRYQDIYPLNFWPAAEGDRKALWEACREVLEFWIARDVRIFRVDNPHTKPLAFWAWVIEAVRAAHPDVVFLAEAFTRPKMMAKLAEVGFSQSYTYFTWRTTGPELRGYLEELAHGPVADYMRPNLWPNTPDILSGPLRLGPRAAFAIRLVLAATLSPSYGIYSGYELCENEPASPDNEEYRHSEKYELRSRPWGDPASLAPLVGQLNDIRRRHPALGELRTIAFHHTNDPALLAYSKRSSSAGSGGDTGGDTVLVVVNLDPHAAHADWLGLDLEALGVAADAPYEAFDELTGVSYTWQGATPYVRLDPALPAHVLSLRT